MMACDGRPRHRVVSIWLRQSLSGGEAVSAREQYNQIRTSVRLDEEAANAIVAAARPHAEGLLLPPSQDAQRIQVAARRVLPSDARGGSLIPAWPIRQADGSVTIEFVEDWGVMLASW